jgi:Integral membrane protein CcmA involved in cell shape determination
MWKTNQQSETSSISAASPSLNPVEPATVAAPTTIRRAQPTAVDQAAVGKGLIFKGEISGKGALFIDGKVEGSINLPGERVSIGIHGRVEATMTSTSSACINAREIVIMGHVRGNISASERVEIRTEGTLDGDVSTARISIADGAIFRGGVDLKKTEAKPERVVIDNYRRTSSQVLDELESA